jgi:hypothetical protein
MAFSILGKDSILHRIHSSDLPGHGPAKPERLLWPSAFWEVVSHNPLAGIAGGSW